MNVPHGGQGRLEDHGSRVIQRHFAFDAARAIAALFVIAIHVRGGSIMLALSELGRFAVPIFFAISGYFFKASGFKPLLGRIKNLGALYALWVLLYGILNLWVQSWTPNHPVIDLIFGGGAGYQLWFVSSLIQCMVVCFLLQKAGLGDKAILILACALYVLTSLSLTYQVFGRIEWNPHHGPMAGLPFFAFGIWLKNREPDSQAVWLWAVACLALTALNGAEFVAFKFSGLKYQYGVPDVRLATLPLGLAAMMLAYSAKSWSMSGSIWHSALRNLAAISLPIYLMHLACALIIAKIFGVSGVILFVFTVIMTLCLSALANKSPARRLVQVR